MEGIGLQPPNAEAAVATGGAAAHATRSPVARARRRNDIRRENTSCKVLMALFLIGIRINQGEVTRVDSQTDGERQSGLGGGRGSHPAREPVAGSSEPHRHACRL